MSDLEPTETIPLTLEETGQLCHFMMGDRAFRELALKWSTAPHRTELPPYEMRVLNLYNKLSAANARLMRGTR